MLTSNINWLRKMISAENDGSHIRYKIFDLTIHKQNVNAQNEPVGKYFIIYMHSIEAYQIIPKLHLDGMCVGETLFNHRQYIEVYGYSTETQRRFYAKSIHTISYKYVFREREYVTLEWIMNHLSSEQAIHYFKERGVSVCPINLQ